MFLSKMKYPWLQSTLFFTSEPESHGHTCSVTVLVGLGMLVDGYFMLFGTRVFPDLTGWWIPRCWITFSMLGGISGSAYWYTVGLMLALFPLYLDGSFFHVDLILAGPSVWSLVSPVFASLRFSVFFASRQQNAGLSCVVSLLYITCLVWYVFFRYIAQAGLNSGGTSYHLSYLPLLIQLNVSYPG